MKDMFIIEMTDCSEIAYELQQVHKGVGGNGQILRVTPKGFSRLKLVEYGKVDDIFLYHEVYTDGRYVYDPRLSKVPVPKGDWETLVRRMNPGAMIK
ncbi:MAG: hypothetical protein KF773_41515 [Deltaproteobacteria bacterium]|nr:hypothetical protein [Deltaproteobacteria bacterium]